MSLSQLTVNLLMRSKQVHEQVLSEEIFSGRY